MAERLQLMADHGMTKEKLEKCVKTEGAFGMVQSKLLAQERERERGKKKSLECLVRGGSMYMCRQHLLTLRGCNVSVQGRAVCMFGLLNWRSTDHLQGNSLELIQWIQKKGLC